jgi:hypothetical protein
MSFLACMKRVAGRQPDRGPTRPARRPRRAALGLEGLEDHVAPAGLTVTSLGTLTFSSDSLTCNPATLGGAVDNINSSMLTMCDDTVSANTAVQGGGIWNDGALGLIRDNVSYNSLRLATASDPTLPSLQSLGSGLCNSPSAGGSVSLDGSTVIGNNFDGDGSLGDTYGV